jgi:hypothetical protein
LATTVTITARNAGADTVAGETRPPALSVNVAGTRTWIDPPAGLVVVPAGEAPPLAGVLVVLGLSDVLVALEAVVLWVAVLARVPCWVVPTVGAVLAAVLELDECDPPHPASASTAANRKTGRLLTVSA